MPKPRPTQQQPWPPSGGGEIPEYREDVRRQHSYMAYAFLDAGNPSAARIHLMAALGAAGWSDLWARLDAGCLTPWHHALLARFFADTGVASNSEKYLVSCMASPGLVAPDAHPVQLWRFNVGRMALGCGRADIAADFFTQSLDCCLNRSDEPTLFVMALLPLSGLQHLTALGKNRHATALCQVRDAALELNPTHFEKLRSLAPEALLKAIWDQPRSWFPFTYR